MYRIEIIQKKWYEKVFELLIWTNAPMDKLEIIMKTWFRVLCWGATRWAIDPKDGEAVFKRIISESNILFKVNEASGSVWLFDREFILNIADWVLPNTVSEMLWLSDNI